MAILGILAMLVFPSYSEAVRKSRRADATTSLLNLHLAQEQYRASHPRYAETLVELGWSDDPPESHEGYYVLSLDSVDNPRAGFRARAVPRPGSDQENDVCKLFVLDQDGPDPGSSSSPGCWAR